MFVRISKGAYEASLHAAVTTALDKSSKSLVSAIRNLPGCINYYAGSDETSNTMINVSVWDTLEHAQAMGSLPEMMALATEFIALGVMFERPIVNYSVLWKI
jgi:quinol monooxygenase YgiN